MKIALLKSAKLALLLSATIAQISCAQNTIEPYFPGLTEGIKASESCSNYQTYSINLTENEGDQQFDVFQDKNCKDKKIYSLTLGIEASFAGIWKNFLVFDEGTDVNGHNLRMISITNREEVYILYFEGNAPQFEYDKLVYFAPSEQKATANQCNPLGIDFEDLKESSAEVLIGQKIEFSIETKKATPIKDQYTCYAAQ